MEQLEKLFKDAFFSGEELGLNADGRCENPLYWSFEEWLKKNDLKIIKAIQDLKANG